MINSTERQTIINNLYCPEDYETWYKLVLLLRDAGYSIDEVQAWDARGVNPTPLKQLTALYNYKGKTVNEEKALKRLAYKAGVKLEGVEVVNEMPVFNEQQALKKAKKLMQILKDGNGYIYYTQAANDQEKSYPSPLIQRVKYDAVPFDEMMKSGHSFYIMPNGVKDYNVFERQLNQYKSNGKIASSRGYRETDVSSYEYVIIQADDLDINQQLKIITYDLPIVSVTFSGKRSLHCLLHVGAKNKDEWEQRVGYIKEYLKEKKYPFDSMVTRVSCATRFPYCHRAGTVGFQYCVYVNQDFITCDDWCKTYVEKKKFNNMFDITYKKLKDREGKEIKGSDGKPKWGIDKVTLNIHATMQYLAFCGFCKQIIPNSSNAMFYLVRGKSFEEVTPQTISSFLVEVVKRKTDSKERIEAVTKLLHRTTYIKENLPVKRLKKHTDTKETTYLYFAGEQTVAITKEGYNVLSGIDGYVQKNAILPHYFNYRQEKGKFEQFVEKIAGDEERKSAFMTGIGFLVNRYKDEIHNRILVFTDGNMYEDGGSGKSLLLKSFQHVRNYLSIDAKHNNESNERFMFGKITPNHDIVHIQDLQKLQFERLFNMVTGDFTVQQKNKVAVDIKFEDAPKFAISCNILPKQDNNSIVRRVVNFELTDYWISHNVEDELGYLFGSNWTEIDWQEYFSFIVRCVREFHTKGLVAPSTFCLEERLNQAQYGDALEVFRAIEQGAFQEQRFTIQEVLKWAYEKFDYKPMWSTRKFAKKFNKYFKDKITAYHTKIGTKYVLNFMPVINEENPF